MLGSRTPATTMNSAPLLRVTDLKKHFPVHRGLLSRVVGQVYAVDGSAYFNRSGPRLVDGVEILADIFHPDTKRGGDESNRNFKRLS